MHRFQFDSTSADGIQTRNEPLSVSRGKATSTNPSSRMWEGSSRYA